MPSVVIWYEQGALQDERVSEGTIPVARIPMNRTVNKLELNKVWFGKEVEGITNREV